MYRRILLAYDGSLEGRRALREGALLAGMSGARVFLLAIVAEATFKGTLETGPLLQADSAELLADGVARLKKLGLEVDSRHAVGTPSKEIASFAKSLGADLVVIGYQKQGAFSRWWSRQSVDELIHDVQCSVLVGRAAQIGSMSG
jgi:nucleotide-binding universal stress UspA family protein